MVSVSASRIVASKRTPCTPVIPCGPVFQYPRVGSLPRNASGPTVRPRRRDVSVSASRIVASKLQYSSMLLSMGLAVSVSASRIVASKLLMARALYFYVHKFQYPRVGSLPRNVSRSEFRPRANACFSIRESDRCLETDTGEPGFCTDTGVSVSASRIVASKPLPSRMRLSALCGFSIRESDRCLETHPSTALTRSRQVFQYPRVGSLPRNGPRATRARIRRSKFQYPRVGSLPRNVDAGRGVGPRLFVSVSASRIVASKPPTQHCHTGQK